MTPQERARAVIGLESACLEDDGAIYDTWFEYPAQKLFAKLVDEFSAALAEEREACAKAVCLRCAKGEPISAIGECMTMGHFHHGDSCHPCAWDKQGRVTGHIECSA